MICKRIGVICCLLHFLHPTSAERVAIFLYDATATSFSFLLVIDYMPAESERVWLALNSLDCLLRRMKLDEQALAAIVFVGPPCIVIWQAHISAELQPHLTDRAGR